MFEFTGKSTFTRIHSGVEAETRFECETRDTMFGVVSEGGIRQLYPHGFADRKQMLGLTVLESAQKAMEFVKEAIANQYDSDVAHAVLRKVSEKVYAAERRILWEGMTIGDLELLRQELPERTTFMQLCEALKVGESGNEGDYLCGVVTQDVGRGNTGGGQTMKLSMEAPPVPNGGGTEELLERLEKHEAGARAARKALAYQIGAEQADAVLQKVSAEAGRDFDEGLTRSDLALLHQELSPPRTARPMGGHPSK